MLQIVKELKVMNQYERRFYEDIHKLVTIQKEILAELKKMNKPMEVDEARIPKVLVEEDLWQEEK
jgi:hypothetical protein